MQERLIEIEQKDQENQLMKQYLNKLCEEEADKISKRRQEQTVLRDELNAFNAELQRRKELAKEQEKLIDEKVIQFQEEKAVSPTSFCTKIVRYLLFLLRVNICWRSECQNW